LHVPRIINITMTLFLKRSSSNGFRYVQLCYNIKPSSSKQATFQPSSRGEICVKPSFPYQITPLNLRGNWVSLPGNNAFPHMNFSTYTDVDYLSFGTIAWDFVSSIGLYDSRSNSHRNFFAFRFQVKGLVFARGTDINCEAAFIPSSKRPFSRGRSCE